MKSHIKLKICTLAVCLLASMSASSDVNHNALKCGTEVSAHSEKEGHGPVARCVATCEAFTNSSNGESFEAKQSYCPFYNGTLGIRTSIDMDCQCGWGKSHCSNAAGVKKECVVYYNGWFCESENGKQRIGYDIHTLANSVVSSTKHYCDANTPASSTKKVTSTPQGSAVATPVVKPEPDTQIQITSACTLKLGYMGSTSGKGYCITERQQGCMEMFFQSRAPVKITMESESDFDVCVWPLDKGWWNKNAGYTHPNKPWLTLEYGRCFEDASDGHEELIAYSIGTVSPEEIVLEDGLENRMVCIDPYGSAAGPAKVTFEEEE